MNIEQIIERAKSEVWTRKQIKAACHESGLGESERQRAWDACGVTAGPATMPRQAPAAQAAPAAAKLSEHKVIWGMETLVEAVRLFSNLDSATAFFASIRWPHGVCCPNCGSPRVLYLPNRRVWECREKHPRRQFSVKIGTIFEECRLPIDKCLIAVWLEVNAKNSISSCEVARHLGVTQKTAWFLQHRIRLALNEGHFNKMTGTVEADETFVGGKARNMHKGRRKAKGRGVVGKAAVMGLLERHSDKGKSRVRTFVVDNTKRKTLQPIVREHVEPGSSVYTDSLQSYTGLNPEFVHGFVNHAERYADGAVHTNGLENFWSLFKRCIKGTHVSVEPFHLFRYLDAEGFRFNNRTIG